MNLFETERFRIAPQRSKGAAMARFRVGDHILFTDYNGKKRRGRIARLEPEDSPRLLHLDEVNGDPRYKAINVDMVRRIDRPGHQQQDLWGMM
jgi:hypothetical protein